MIIDIHWSKRWDDFTKQGGSVFNLYCVQEGKKV